MKTKLKGLMVMGAIALGQVGQLQAADANPPERMTYQGYLVDGNGVVLGKDVPANYDVVFRIYDAKSGGNKLWSEQQTVTVDKGYFSVLLGEGVKFSNEVYGNLSVAFDGADASDRFIGITVIGLGGVDTEIAPRLRLVTSPYSFTASQARRLTDGSGNSNFAKVGTSLELGAGSTPTLTLPEAGGASLVGKLTADLPSWGTGLQIDNGSLTTTIGAQNSGLFHFNTELPQFYFNKKITVAGDIRSYNTDTILGPSNNTDTYLKIFSASDEIHAYADNFYFKGATDLKVEIEAGSVDFRTTASSFLMNKPLEVEGNLTVNGTISGTPGPVYLSGSQGLRSVTGNYGTVQTTGGGQGTWEGYSIDGRYVFMSDDNDHVGLYNDIDNQWLWDYNRSGNWHKWYKDGAWKMYLSSSDLYLSDGWFGRYSHHTGGLMGSYNSVGGNGSKTNPIYIIGSSYKPAESTLSNMYGLGYSDGGASFITGNANGWGMYIAADGDARTFLSAQAGKNSYISRDGGNVGIGTDSPALPLHIKSNQKVYGDIALMRLTGSGSNWDIGMDDEGGTADDDLTFWYNGVQEGWMDPGSNAWKVPSDKRLKKNIEPFRSGILDGIGNITVYTYNMKNDSDDAPVQVGVMAQDIQNEFPELVEAEDSLLGLDYGRVSILAFSAIQELRAEKDQQLADRDQQLAEKTRRIDELEGRMAKLEELVSKIGQGQ